MSTILRRQGAGRSSGRRPGAASAGPVGRRRPLPGSRAVVGGFLVAAAAFLVLSAWIDTGRVHHQPWVVARHDLAAGTRLAPGDLGTEPMSLPATTTGAQAFHSATSLLGRVLAEPLLPGELVQQGTLVTSGGQPALRPVTVPLDAADAEDLSIGADVDVLVTDGSDPGDTTSVVVRGATVLDVTAASSSLIASSGGGTVTLGVASLSEVEAVVHAAHTGSLSVVVAQRSDGQGLGPASTAGAAGAGSSTATGTGSRTGSGTGTGG